MTIEFGEWQLRPLDETNWELYHRHETSRGKDRGEVKYHPCGKYFSASTFDNAFRYAADTDAKGLAGTFSPSEFLDAYKGILDGFMKDVSETLRTRRSREG